MEKEIKITKKSPYKGDDGHKIVSVRLSKKTNRSRNELINLLIESAIKLVVVEE